MTHHGAYNRESPARFENRIKPRCEFSGSLKVLDFRPRASCCVLEQDSKKMKSIRKPKLLLILLDFSLTVKAATLIFISGYGSAI